MKNSKSKTYVGITADGRRVRVRIPSLERASKRTASGVPIIDLNAAGAAALCAVHPHATLRCPACAGSRGGSKTSPKKSRAARRNGKLGGAPVKPAKESK